MRKRVDQLGSQAREAAGELGAFAVDSVQGLGEIVAFQQETARGDKLDQLSQRHISLRLPFFSELTLQHAILEVLTGLGAWPSSWSARHWRNAVSSIPACCRCSPSSPWRPSCRCRRSPRSAGSSPTRWARRGGVYALSNEPILVRDDPACHHAQGPQPWLWRM